MFRALSIALSNRLARRLHLKRRNWSKLWLRAGSLQLPLQLWLGLDAFMATAQDFFDSGWRSFADLVDRRDCCYTTGRGLG